MNQKQTYVSLLFMLYTISLPAQQVLKKTRNPVLAEKPVLIVQTTPDVSNIQNLVKISVIEKLLGGNKFQFH